MLKRDHGEAPGRQSESGSAIFESLWPSESAGDGCVRANNLESGDGQGRGSLKRKVSCKQCGYIYDANAHSHEGGSLDGNGGGGGITSTSTSYTTSAGVSVSISYGEQAFNRGGGCPLCFSRNGASFMRPEVTGPSAPSDIGF